MFEGARKQKFKITFVILGVSVIVLVISFARGQGHTAKKKWCRDWPLIA